MKIFVLPHDKPDEISDFKEYVNEKLHPLSVESIKPITRQFNSQTFRNTDLVSKPRVVN